jgi:hypothetical protein
MNAVLVDGYGGSVSITGITRSGATATATCSVTDILKLKTGTILTISGAGQSEYNIAASITIASTTTFTYLISGSPVTATGTIVGSLKLGITSITRSGAVATATLSQVNTTLMTGQWMVIEGAAQTEYNGTLQITVVDSTHFTFAVTGTPTSPATGTLTYYKAGLQWTRPFAAGTNSQTYQSADITSNRFYLQLIDNGATTGGAKEAQAYGVEVMTGDQTVTSGRFPIPASFANGLCWYKSTTADTVQRPWTIFGDDRTFYVFVDSDSAGTARVHYGFGHFITFKAGDSFNTFIGGSEAFNTSIALALPGTRQTVAKYNNANGYGYSFTTPCRGGYVARSHSQSGGGVTLNGFVPGSASAVWPNADSGSTGGQAETGSPLSSNEGTSYPNGSDSGLYVGPMLAYECTTGFPWRGRLPGIFGSMHNRPLAHYETAVNVVGLGAVTLTAVYLTTLGEALLDTYGPWT